MTKSRTPPVWLVLLPAFALAAVGVRAVTAEMRASQDAARDRARSIASRLARSVDALVSEYAAPLPTTTAELSTEAATATVEHLDPHGNFRVPHAEYRESRVVESMRPVRIQVWDDSTAADRELVEDALARASRLADSGDGAVGAAALIAATAQVMQPSHALWPLRYAEARYDVAVGDRERALAAVAAAWRDGGRTFRVLDGTPYPDVAVALAADIVGASEPPNWLISALEHCARRPFFEDESAADSLWRPLAGASAERLRPARRLRAAAQRLVASSRGEKVSTAALSMDGGTLRVSVWRSVLTGDGWSLLGGEVPAVVVEDRVVHEARALASESGVASVRLAPTAGEGALDIQGATTDARNAVVETARLAYPLSAWRAEAVVAPESGVPATAWLLGAAVVATTAALLAGTIALRRAADRSARLAEDRQTFLDHVAHELRTPAAAVQALTEELASGHVPAEREAVYREHLLRELRRLSNLVEETLDLTRLDAGRLAFKMEPADLRDVVRQAIEQSDGSGRVVAKLPDEAIVRNVDVGALRRAVKNLVENAVRHGGGDEPVIVALETSDGAVAIAVTDRGRGIAREHVPRLFERFYRVPSPTHETKGVGLGLALCREVARAHGGDVHVTSELGKGSTFTLRIA